MEQLKKTVNISDKLGYIYWFAVLTTISFGCMTGIYETLKNRNEMIDSCQAKYESYEHFWLRNNVTVPINTVPWTIDNGNKTNQMDSIFEREELHGLAEIYDLMHRIDVLDHLIACV